MMKLFKSICLLGLYVCIFDSCAFTESWLNLYDIQEPDYLRIVPAVNGVYVAGLTVPASGSREFWILRLNSDGTIAWKKNFDGPDATDPVLLPFSIIALNDGSVLLWGRYSDPLGSATHTAIKISDSGAILWQQKYTGAPNHDFSIDTMAQNPDGTFALFGSGIFGQYTYYSWFAKLSSTGTILSQKLLDPSIHRRGALASVSISDGVIMSGAKCQVQGSNCINQMAWVGKYSTAGALQWEKQIAVPALISPVVYFVRQTSDGGFLVGIGNPQALAPFVSILVKLNSTGAFQWSKSFGQSPDLFQFKATQDGGLVSMPWPSVTLTKMDSGPSILWDKHYDPLPGFYTWGYDVTEGSDGSFYLVASYSCDLESRNGLFVMKVSNNGESCTTVSSNTTMQGTTSVTVSSLSAPSETSAPNTTLPGEFTPTDSSAPQTPICNSGGFNTNCVLSTLVCGADTVTFNFPAPSTTHKVLISKYGTSDSYPETQQTQPRKIKIKATVRDGCGQPLDNKLVYFKVIDPPDSSPYIQNPQPDDNEETKNQPPNDSDSGTLTSDHDTSADGGIVETELTITDEYGGDNYQIEARFQSQSDPVQATSGTLTAWKRAYAEHTLMYKKGEFLRSNSVAGGTQTILSVKTASTFSVNDKVHVFSGTENPQSNLAPLIGEKAVVMAINTTTNTITVQKDSNNDGIPDSPPRGLTLAYPGGGLGDPCNAPPPYGFVGRIANGWYDASPTSSKLAVSFDDTFVEWMILPGYNIPTWMNACAQSDFTDVRSHYFFSNFVYNTLQPRENHIQVVSAAFYEPPGNQIKTLLGLTSAKGYSHNYSWIFWERIKQQSPSQINAVVDNTVAHELGHEWNVNSSSPVCPQNDPNCEHDAQNACSPPASQKCIMNEARVRTVTQRFHCNLSAPSKDLFCIRGHVDGLISNQDTCTWP